MKINTEKIKNILEARGMSAHDLAVLMGRRDSWVYSILAGEGGKTFKVVTELAKALGVKSTELIED